MVGEHRAGLRRRAVLDCLSLGSLEWSDAVVSDNVAGYDGGGAYISGSPTTLRDVVLEGNDGEYGGGTSLNLGTVPYLLERVSCLDNTGDQGAATDLYGGANVVLTDATVQGNTGALGALYMWPYATLDAVDVDFADNAEADVMLIDVGGATQGYTLGPDTTVTCVAFTLSCE